MLERLEIRGFQNHKKKVLELDPLITTLTGPSDRGKSAVIRALRWLCLNKSPKKKFIHWDREVAVVTLYIDGHKIVRKKGKGINAYYMDGEELKSFNRGVPEQISNILKVSDLNFQRQHDPHFWISLPPLQVSKELNQLVDLDVIDRSLSKVSSQLRKAKVEVEVVEDRLKEARQKRKELKWVVRCNKKLKEIERRNQLIVGGLASALQLSSLISDVSTLKLESKGLTKRIVLIENLLSHAKIVLETTEQVEQLEELIGRIEEGNCLAIIELPDISNLELLIGQEEELSEAIEQWEELESCLQETESQEGKVLKSLSKVKRCPVCGQPMRNGQKYLDMLDCTKHLP